MMDFSPFVEQIKSAFKKKQLNVFDSIVAFDSLQLVSMGHSDSVPSDEICQRIDESYALVKK